MLSFENPKLKEVSAGKIEKQDYKNVDGMMITKRRDFKEAHREARR